MTRDKVVKLVVFKKIIEMKGDNDWVEYGIFAICQINLVNLLFVLVS